MNIEGYRSHRMDRTDAFKQKYQKSGGGGTALIYRKDLKVTQIKNDKQLELEVSTWFRLLFGKVNYILGVLCRPHYVDILKGDPSQLELSLTRAAQLSCNIMLIYWRTLIPLKS